MINRGSMIKKPILFTIVFVIFLQLVNAQQQQLENLLFELPDVIFEEIRTANGFETTYKLYIKQPLDHAQPSQGFFYQKAYLSHRGFNRPTVLITEGYSCTRPRENELTDLLNANQIEVEHRFFGESLPDSINYNYLNLEQATADLHYINQLFKQIYKDKWISTGISKGGATTIFYRYFYPDDVNVSVPYVAPINTTFEEERIYQFLDTMGSDDCRKNILSFQKRLLKKRDKVMPMLQMYSKGARLEFTYLTMEEAFEYAVLEFPFSLWQWGHLCTDIPANTTSIVNTLEYFLDVSDIAFFSDKDIAAYGPHYYQSATEMGYYGYETEDFKGLLKAIPTPNPHATFVPLKMPTTFDGSLLEKLDNWLPENGNQIIYIYGAMDTWSASAVPYSDKVDAVWFMMEGKHHGSARIRNMNSEEKQKLIATLENWLDLKIENTGSVNTVK